MKTVRTMGSAALIVGSGLALLVSCTQQAETGRTDRATAPAAARRHGGPLRETVTIAADAPIPNLPGKRLVSRIVNYPPGASSVPHRHAPSAFIYAFVLSGAVRSQVNDEPARVYRPGETWFENPGAHHRVSENASDTEPARLLAVFIIDEADKQLTIPDAE
jgi:quercetin dioxygenase-like cupin family protein